MSHLDEGTLHALLDGELDLHEVKEIQAHIGSCAACGTRLREVKDFHGESDRLVSVLQVPNSPSRRITPDDFDPMVERRSVSPPPPRRPVRTSGPNTEPPPLLIPDNPDQRRSRFMGRMRWAALLFVTVGAGYIGNEMRQGRVFGFGPSQLPKAPADSMSEAVLSSEEAVSAQKTEAAGGGPTAGSANTRTPARDEAKATQPVPKRVAPRAETPPAGERGGAAPAAAAAESAEDRSDTGAAGEEQGALLSQARANETAEESAPSPQRQADIRTEAARALRDLDRERQLDRAAAATAALDSARRRQELAARQTTVMTAPPAPRTPEQRAQTYLRIGLDEAARQLGRPVHVIEGWSPLFMGLVKGGSSPGADQSRPVVRVVYQDSQGRLIFLDQQRLRPSQSTTPPGGSDPHWIQGEISLHLSGEVGPDVLKSLRARVR